MCRDTIKTHFCLIIYLIILPVQVVSKNLYVDRIGLDKGLSLNTVTGIVKDAKGYMWFATRNGLNQYDSYNIKVYLPDENSSGSITSKDVEDLLVDKDGMLWVGTRNGLNTYHSDTDKFSVWTDNGNSNSLENTRIEALFEDRQGNIWVGSWDGLYVIDQDRKTTDKFQYIENNDSTLNSNIVLSLYQDGDGAIWVGTDKGLNKYDNRNKSFIRIKSINNVIVYAIIEDRQGNLWIGSRNEGIYVLNQQGNLINRYKYDASDPDSISTDSIYKFYKDSKQRIWVGTFGGGLNLYNEINDSFIHYRYDANNPNGLSDDVIFSLYEDDTGVFWIGTYGNGISKLNPYGFGSSLVSNKPSASNPNPQSSIRTFLVDNEESLWVGSSDKGLRVTMKNGEIINYLHNPNDNNSLSNNRVYSLYEDSLKTVWVGTANGWLNEYNRSNGTFNRYQLRNNAENSIFHAGIRSIISDGSETLWLATLSSGLHAFNIKTKQVKHYHFNPNNPNSINSNDLIRLHMDQFNNIWIATTHGGLNKLDQATGNFSVIHRPYKNKFQYDPDIAFYEDINDNVLWIGTDGSGLDRLELKTGRFENFNIKDGLRSKSVYGILPGVNGVLWLSHDKGLTRFNFNAMSFKHYDKSDGLQSNEYNGGAYYKSPSGKLYFGGIKGYNSFYPTKIIDNPYKPQVYITGFQLFNHRIAIGEKYDKRILLPKPVSELNLLTLSHKDTVFSLEFTALNYVNSVKNQFAYKMEGLEENWNYVDSQRRFATYTTLPPGNYKFRVKASNNSGVWNENGASLAISILPPFWKTWWFKTTSIFLLLVIFYMFYWLRVKGIQKRNKVLESKVKQRTAELLREKANLEDALLELGETKDAFEVSSKIATGTLHNVGNMLNSINISISLIQNQIQKSVLDKFIKANNVLRENFNNLEEFISNGDKGKNLIGYYFNLEKIFIKEKKEIDENVKLSLEKVSSMTDAISAQQRSACGQGFVEWMSLEDLVEESIALLKGSDMVKDIVFEKQYKPIQKIKIEKAKLIQVLLNLYKNSKESMYEANLEEKIITIELDKDDVYAYIRVSDNGIGIESERISEVCGFGFTTKSSGHGFGLHSCANYMESMGGLIIINSDGVGKGASVTLKLPLLGIASVKHAANDDSTFGKKTA